MRRRHEEPAASSRTAAGPTERSADPTARSADPTAWSAGTSERSGFASSAGPLGAPTPPRPRLTPRALFAEALAGLLQRPARSLLTMAGTVLGLGAFVAILGLTATAAGQISTAFTVLKATQVTVTQDPPAKKPAMPFPADTTARLDRINGVVAAGAYWKVPLASGVTTSAWPSGDDGLPLDVYAAAPGALQAAGIHVAAGRVYDQFSEDHQAKVAVVSTAIAKRLGISQVGAAPAVFIGQDAYTVVGTFTTTDRIPGLALGVIIPAQTALARYGPPSIDNPAQVLIATRLGAAQTVAAQAPVALRPDNPTLLAAQAPPDPTSLRHTVSTTTNSLLLLLAVIALLVGAIGIANTTLVAVMERTSEIGLRRALGAEPRHIAAQFLAEAALLGLAGGVLAMTLGVATVLGVSLAHHWTAVVDLRLVYPVPIAGALIGALAGLYPALKTTRIEPAEALRR